MEDVVAVKVVSESGPPAYFVTWGRIQHVVDPMHVERIVLRNAHRFALPGVAISAQLCHSLRDARDAEWFYEALLYFAGRPIPYGPKYREWVKRIDERMRGGKELYFAGCDLPLTATVTAEAGTIASGTIGFD